MNSLIKKWICLLAAVVLAMGGALAETSPAATLSPDEAEAERARTIVEALFAACAGTDTQTETALRAEMTDEERAQRMTELAEYRAVALPWLEAALTPEMEESEPLLETEPELPEDEPLPETEPWSAEDALALFRTTQAGMNYLALLEGQDAAQCLEETQAACRLWMAEIDHAALTEMNGDYACWLYCPDSAIDYPVVQGDDNSWYLHRLFDGSYNSCGTLFVDYRNLPDFQDPNTLIYGHHMSNGSMFKGITYYAEQVYYDAHPWMLISSGREVALLELFAGYLTDKRDHCYDIAISDEADLSAFAQTALEKSDFRAEIEILPGDRLVTLSTCAYAFENARYILIGRLDSLWQTE